MPSPVSRGTANSRPTSPDRGIDRTTPKGARGVRVNSRASEVERQAAERLGGLCMLLSEERGGFPFDTWVLPNVESRMPLFAKKLGEIYGSDDVRDRLYKPYQNRYQLYRRDYDAVMPAVREQAVEFAKKTLNAEQLELGNLLLRLEKEPGLPMRLQTIANQVAVKAGGFGATEQEVIDAYETRLPPPNEPRFNRLTGAVESVSIGEGTRFSLNRGKVDKAIRKRFAKAVREKQDKTLSTLFAHPQGVSILAAYSNNATTGTQFAAGLVEEAIQSVMGFRTELTESGNEDHVWRYPLLVTGGVTLLGLDDIRGFKEYAVAVGQVLGRNFYEGLVTAAGWAILCFGLVFTGPVGALAIAAADLAIAGAGAGLAYIREREQELGVGASRFRAEDDKLATSSGYADTILGGAAALLSAIAFFKAAEATHKLLQIRAKAINEILPPRGAVAPEKLRPNTLSMVTPDSRTVTQLESGANQAADLEGAWIEGPRREPTSFSKEEVEQARLNLQKASPSLKPLNFEEIAVTASQKETFGCLAGSLFADKAERAAPQAADATRAALLRKAESDAANLRGRMETHWATALPRRGKQTAEDAAFELLQDISKTTPAGSQANRAIRDKFFSSWRKRFLDSIARDQKLINDLQVQAGVIFNRNAGVGGNAFSVPFRDANGIRLVGLDIDHAIIRHEQAVINALRTGDSRHLLSTVDGKNLQFLTERENRNFIEELRKRDRSMWSAPPQTASDFQP